MGNVVDPEFGRCLASGKIRRFPAGPDIAPRELATAEQDFTEAERTFAASGYKWATIQAYYAMFHTARALIYAGSYRERSHHCLVIALRALYVSARKLELEFVEGLEAGKRLRENADYYGRFSEAGADKVLSLAAKFIVRAKKLIGNRDQKSGEVEKA